MSNKVSTKKNIVEKTLEEMRKKLLDLTTRNRLLNLPINTKNSLRIVGVSPNQLYHALLKRCEIFFDPVPLPTSAQLLHFGYEDQEKKAAKKIDSVEWAEKIGISTSYVLPKDLKHMIPVAKTAASDKKSMVKNNMIQTLHYIDELDARLKYINLKALAEIQEKGASILYLSFGCLEWCDAVDTSKRYLAPLFNIPVILERKRQKGFYKYYVVYTGDVADILINQSLKKKLQNDHDLELPSIQDNMLPETYLQAVEEAVQNYQSDWKVHHYGMLSLLRFSTMLLYHDLDPARWPSGDKNILNHNVVQSLCTFQPIDENVFEELTEHLIDEVPDIHQKFPLIDNADSSQHSAIIDATNGKNLVIEGPPGTGKSQTIANIIACAIQSGKKVLFVAEKLVALEVVQKRLNKANLGDFCLSLHVQSHNKKEKDRLKAMFDDIQLRMDKQNTYKEVNLKVDIANYKSLAQELNTYMQDINSIWGKTDLSIHQILAGFTRYRREFDLDPKTIHVDNLSGETLDHTKLYQLEEKIKEFQAVAKKLLGQIGENAQFSDHPWYGVDNLDIGHFFNEQIMKLLKEWQNSIVSLKKTFQAFCKTYNQDCTIKLDEQFINNIDALPDALPKDLDFCLLKLKNDEIQKIQAWVDHYTVLQNNYKELSQYISPEQMKKMVTMEAMPEFLDLEASFGISAKTTIRDVHADIQKLAKLYHSLEQHYALFLPLKDSLPRLMSEQMTLSYAGLSYLATVIRLASLLPVEFVDYRNDCFEDSKIDQALTELQKNVVPFQDLYLELNPIFKLENLPSDNVLKKLENQLNQKKWFAKWQAEWKEARDALTQLAHDAHQKDWNMLHGKLHNLRQYIKYKQLVESKKDHFQDIFGHMYQGLDTDVQALKTIRQWYVSARKAWGVGFGKTATMGDSFIHLSSHLIAKLQEHKGLDQHIMDHLEHLDKINKHINLSLHKNTALLGHDSVLLHTKNKLIDALQLIQTWFENSDTTVNDVNKKITLMKKSHVIQKKLSHDDVFQKFLSHYGSIEGFNQLKLKIIEKTVGYLKTIKEMVYDKVLLRIVLNATHCRNYLTIYQKLKEVKKDWTQYILCQNQFIKESKLDLQKWSKNRLNDHDYLIERNAIALSKKNWLTDWVNFMRIVKQMEEAGLSKIKNLVLQNKLPLEKIQSLFKLALYDQLAREICAEKKELISIFGGKLDRLKQAFKECDKKLQSLQRQAIAHQASSNFSHQDELRTIRFELNKTKSHLPIRKLIQLAGRGLLELKPCLMMSPISVAQYLEPGDLFFDLIIFDEASQVKPEEAIGVIARGSQIIVVGDSKQLPPTTFFDGVDHDDAEIEEIAINQTESILDALKPLFHIRQLRWHYRSQHESLIAFSNQHFYNNNLVIFPSPYTHSDTYGLKYHFIQNGQFKNNHNLEEASSVAAAIAQHMLQNKHESLGVITMNIHQRDCIESELNKIAKRDPVIGAELENWLNKEDDNLFIKNLENVQGDERDVIFISFTYGSADNNTLKQNFGPINLEMGWRRLNVLFTRAKKRMHVFTSLRSMDIATSTRKGIKGLRDFLYFAEKGGQLEHKSALAANYPESDFEISVTEMLEKAGFKCVSRVGLAGSYIDVAVCNPEASGAYLMGIECDSTIQKNTHKSARDRDTLRGEVFEKLGWRVRRIWSTDWFNNPESSIKPIIQELKKLTKSRDSTK